MFDRLGRVMCAHCGDRMRVVEVTHRAALFTCDGCAHAVAITWDPQKKGGPKPPFPSGLPARLTSPG